MARTSVTTLLQVFISVQLRPSPLNGLIPTICFQRARRDISIFISRVTGKDNNKTEATTMISVRSSMIRSIVGGRSTPNAGAAFLQANLSFPSSSSDEAKKNNSSPTVRHFVAPAYRRYLNRQKFLQENIRGLKPSIGAHAPGIQKPSLEVAKDMGRSFSEMENDALMVIAEMGSHSARCEVLKRHIMAIDEVDYDTAGKTLDGITAKSLEGLFFYTLPYKIGITCAIVSGVGAIPMVFDISTAMSFNETFVTMDIPPPSDLDTVYGKCLEICRLSCAQIKSKFSCIGCTFFVLNSFLCVP